MPSQFLKRKAKEAAQKEQATQVETPEVKQEIVIKTEDVAPLAKPHKAYNIFFDSKIKKYMLVHIEYDPTRVSAQVVKIEEWADSPAVALKKLADIMSLKVIRREEDV